MKVIDILNKLSAARMEQQNESNSVYNRFVVPFFIDQCDLRKISHSIALEGSRGSGKSTYIQYFSHATRFDKARINVSKEELDAIVLYWKPDTAFCQGLKKEWLNEKAEYFFNAHMGYSILLELNSLIDKLFYHFPEVKTHLDNGKCFFNRVSKVLKKEVRSTNEIKNVVDEYNYELSTKINPPVIDGVLSLIPQKMFIYLMDGLKQDTLLLEHTKIKIFVDEFELLSNDQQAIINTYRKESTNVYCWNVAYKANAKPSVQTSSNQWLQTPDDFRVENLDSLILSDYKLYAAEIFLLTLQNAGLSTDLIIEPIFLGDRRNIEHRKKAEYRDAVLSLIRNILPTPSIENLSAMALSLNSVKNKITEALSKSAFNQSQIKCVLSDPSLAITFYGTYKQKSHDSKAYMDDIERKSRRTKKIKDKISTYEFNTLLSLNLQLSSVNLPVYAGFERFITMTTPNVRHFKELCFNALKQHNEEDSTNEFGRIEDMPKVSPERSHKGAVLTSSALVKEVISFPPHGNKLSQMVNRIGELFRISQKSSYQTEPERDIFTIEYDFSGKDSELEDFIESAKSWRVLIVDDSKRIKDETQMTSQEFQLNPIYSPRFGISHRKKRGISFSVRQFKSILVGSYDEYEKIKKHYQTAWRATEDEEKQGILL
ncbi:hypothetical protein [Lacimicrobium alkaliphilum]|uniref:Uncharacterized protein n=1 Tax=Lacimicrobium alkaliphilum TaxID=1526571 RepID=A0A0U2RIR2_9ALTE|nr:hypothetical protein [Lacimicrobium alkaliphilum]ALS97098.1 hypothetical protein AT746_01580 [Lacimicrobium alkaliphilum]